MGVWTATGVVAAHRFPRSPGGPRRRGQDFSPTVWRGRAAAAPWRVRIDLYVVASTRETPAGPRVLRALGPGPIRPNRRRAGRKSRCKLITIGRWLYQYYPML